MSHHNVSNTILKAENRPECPLCLESLELDDINFYPCECGYQVCRFCWHRIRTDENGLCPQCRKPYSENPAEYIPLSQEQLQKMKEVKRQRSMDKKHKVIESRKSLTNVRVVQKNLVFVIGLSPRLADPEVLKKPEYFGKFGRIYRVVINSSTVYTCSQGNSLGAYITFYRSEDATKAIQAVNNAHVDGRCLKASLGTTKYCSHFLAGLACPKADCLFLHELGEEEASFTKEDMQLGKHQTYETATLAQTANVSTVSKEQDKQPQYNKRPLIAQKSKEYDSIPEPVNFQSESALPATAHWASQSSKVPDIPKPIITQALHTTDLKTNDINTAVKNSSEIRSDRPIDDLSSLTIQDNIISNVATLTNSGGYDPTGHHNSFAVLQIVNEEVSSINSNIAINSTGDVMLERQGSSDSDNSRNHQQCQNSVKESVPSQQPHKGQQSKPGNNKAPKKHKDKKNTAKDKSKQSSGHASGGTSPVKHDNAPKVDKENTATTAGGTGGDVHKKKKDNVVAPTEIAVPPVTAVSMSETVVEHKAPPTSGVKAPPPGLTKQPSHTNAVNVLSQLTRNQSNTSYGLNWPDLSTLNDDDELGFDPWSISSKGFEDMFTSQPATTVHHSQPPPLVDTVKTERHSQPSLSSTFVDPQRQAAAAYVNYGPITNDQLHQLQYQGIPIHQQQHSPRSHPPTASNSTMENQLRALLPGINISVDPGARYPPHQNNTHYTSTQQVQPPPSLPMVPHVPSRPTLPLTHRPAVTSSRHVIASPFDIPSLSYVTSSTQSGWPDLINSSDSRGGSVNSSSVGCVGGRAMMREPVTASHRQPQPTVFPSNPEPFQDYRMNHTGMKYSAPVTSRTIAGTTRQADGELNKGEYNLWSDNSSFGTDFNFFSSYATEYHQTIIKASCSIKRQTATR